MPRAALALLAYVLIFALSAWHLAQEGRFDAGEAVAVLVVFGLGCSLLAWMASRGVTPRPHPVRRPTRESFLLMAYLAVFAVGFLGAGLSTIREGIPPGRLQELVVLLAKLTTMVAIPLGLFVALGYRRGEVLALPRPSRAEWRVAIVMALALGLIQAVLGRGLAAVAELDAPLFTVLALAPACFAWATLEAGLTEEFLFRALVQARFAAWMRSETAGIVAMALLFGLAHAPGYVLRSAHLMEGFAAAPSPLTAAAYAVTVTSAAGLVFGVIWARTRNLLLVAVLHGWMDTLPALADFVRMWR